MTRLQYPLHLSCTQLLLANLANVLKANPKALSQLSQRNSTALIGLQYSAPKIIRKGSRHAFSFTENRAANTLPLNPYIRG